MLLRCCNCRVDLVSPKTLHRPKHDTSNGNRRNEIAGFSHTAQSHHIPATAATKSWNFPTSSPKPKRAMHTIGPKTYKQNNGNRRNKIVEFTHNAIQSHNHKPATAATKSRIFPTHHMQLSAQTQHKQQNGNRRNKIVEFTHDGHTQKTLTQHALNTHQRKHDTNNIVRQRPQQNRGIFPRGGGLELKISRLQKPLKYLVL